MGKVLRNEGESLVKGKIYCSKRGKSSVMKEKVFCMKGKAW